MINLGSHSRILPLLPNIPSQILSIAEDRNDPTTYLISVLNSIDGITPSIFLTGIYTGPSGIETPIGTQIAPREQVQYYVTGSFNLEAVAAAQTNVEVSVTASGGGFITQPSVRFTIATTVAAWVGLSATAGCAPPGRRWFVSYADAAFDLQIRDPAGVVIWTAAAIGTTHPRFSGPMILPNGFNLRGKGNGGNVNITTVWLQRGSG